KLTPTTLALVISAGSIAFASPAAAQYGMPAPKAPPQVPQQSADEAPAATKGPSVSNAARKEILALQTAVNAKDAATIPTALAAARAKAKTKDDNYVIAKLQLKAAADANDVNAMAQGAEAVLASGYAAAPEQATLGL